MGIMKIIRGCDTDVMYPASLAFAAKLFKVPIEALELNEKCGFRKILVNDPYSIMFIHCGNKVVSRVFDGFHVAGRYVACSTEESEVIHIDDLSFLIL
jgi:hypothetical protein